MGLLAGASAAMAWAAAIAKLATLRRNLDNGCARALVAALCWLAAAMTFLVPVVYHAIALISGVPNLAWAMSIACWLLSGTSAVVVLIHHTAAPTDAIRRSR